MNFQDLNALCRTSDYYENYIPDWMRSVWQKPEGFQWFLKNNRRQLVESGALVRLGRDYFVSQEAFEGVAFRLLTHNSCRPPEQMTNSTASPSDFIHASRARGGPP
jgi:hypothetical protein